MERDFGLSHQDLPTPIYPNKRELQSARFIMQLCQYLFTSLFSSVYLLLYFFFCSLPKVLYNDAHSERMERNILLKLCLAEKKNYCPIQESIAIFFLLVAYSIERSN